MSLTSYPLPTSELLGVVQVALFKRGVAAEKGMAGHVGAIAARRRGPAERFCDCANVVRPGSAAHAEVVDTELMGGGSELAELVSVAGEWVQCRGKRSIARNTVT